jgi:undecaprenyl phosphate-alpha-L-ara4FN deformylase
MRDRVIHLRVDVDFNEGLKRGVPYLLDLFDRLDMRATFYVVMGPDTLHKHSLKVRSKAFRRRITSLKWTKILRILGPAYLKSRLFPMSVAGGFPETLREIRRRGHEIGVHGFDHAMWADHIFEMDEAATRQQMDLAFARFRDLLGFEAATWGAPNWRCNEHMFTRLSEKGISFSSNTRGNSPFFPSINGKLFKVLELPITLPCLHELVQHGCPRAEIPEVLERCLRPDFNLLCLHDYFEGLLDRDLFESCVERLRRAGWGFHPLGELAHVLEQIEVEKDRVDTVLVPGGVGKVSCQGEFLLDNYFPKLSPRGGSVPVELALPAEKTTARKDLQS